MPREFKLKREMPSLGGVTPECDCVECHGLRKFNRNFKGHEPPLVLEQNYSWFEVAEQVDGGKEKLLFAGVCPESGDVAIVETDPFAFTRNPEFRLDREEGVCSYARECLDTDCPHCHTEADTSAVETATSISGILK